MATFTMELKRAIALTPDGMTVDKWIGLDDYPLYSGVDREALNEKIKRQYWNQEIGMETISMFAFAVRRKMHLEMPLMNLMYESAALKFDALTTINIESTNTAESTQGGTAKSVNVNTSESGSKSLTVASEFPQSALSERGAYATSSQDGDGTSKVTANATAEDENASNTTGSGSTLTKGMQGNAADLIIAQRATFLNIDAMVVTMLADCFMQLWSDGASHLVRRGY